MKNWNLYRTIRDNIYLTPARLGLMVCVAMTVWAMVFTTKECTEIRGSVLGKAGYIQSGTNFQVAVHEACKKQPVEPLWFY